MNETNGEDRENHLFDEAKTILNTLLEGMGVKSSFEVYHHDGRTVINILCEPDDSIVIGRKGKTLEAIQTILNHILVHRHRDVLPYVVDAGGYRHRKRKNLIDLAHRSAEKVKENGYTVIEGPFNAYERHIIHAALHDTPGIVTQSLGEGENKKIAIKLQLVED